MLESAQLLLKHSAIRFHNDLYYLKINWPPESARWQMEIAELSTASAAVLKIGFISAFIRMQMLDKPMARALQHKS
jgi:hypothetical protein